MTINCDVDATDLAKAAPCVDALSKDVEGELELLEDLAPHTCRGLRCRTLTAHQEIEVKVSAHDCDSELGRLLDGPLTISPLTTVYEDGDPRRRGIHAGEFRWGRRGLVITGSVHGVTNAGTLRQPLDPACERCEAPGVMQGRLCGVVRRSLVAPQLVGASVQAVYRFHAEPMDAVGSVGLRGTIEGAILRECGRHEDCIELATLAGGGNPRVEHGHTIEVSDLSGLRPTTDIVTWGTVTGLHVWHHTTIDLAAPADQVVLTVALFATPGTVTAFDAAGSVVALVPIVGPQNMPIDVVVSGTDIVRIEIDCPQDEHLLLKLCV